MPAVAIEAGISGLPVAGYDVAGLSEVVEDGTSGFLVPWGDVDGLALRVSKLLHDEELRRSMGSAGRDICRGRFDIRALAPRYMGVYREVVRDR